MSEQDRKNENQCIPYVDLQDENVRLKAATAEANKRIDALEGEVAEFKGRINDIASDWQVKEIECQRHRSTNAELQANNHDLREALKLTLGVITGETLSKSFLTKALEKSKQALSASPAESLQAHDDEVIEKCAKVADRFIKQEHSDGNSATALMLVQDYIRALKGK